MPPLTRYFIKASLIYLVSALLVGGAALARAPLGLPSWVGLLQPVYYHLLMVGWVTQMIFGVAYWMFPKFSKTEPRRSVPLGWAIFITLNIGLLLRVVGEPLVTLNPASGLGWMLAVSAVLQWIAGFGFIVNTWARVKER
ncbi:MAG: hypothetical protein IT320_27705 [Anaerolineae bacterium]|nr:hypothetical protein [Anaerolineae bacterium]